MHWSLDNKKRLSKYPLGRVVTAQPRLRKLQKITFLHYTIGVKKMKNIKFKKDSIWDASDKYVRGIVETPLKKCPFCGETVEMVFAVNKEDNYASVSIFCKECYTWNYRAKGENKKLYEIADELSEAWNRRA